jgi:hypothetical protein
VCVCVGGGLHVGTHCPFETFCRPHSSSHTHTSQATRGVVSPPPPPGRCVGRGRTCNPGVPTTIMPRSSQTVETLRHQTQWGTRCPTKGMHQGACRQQHTHHTDWGVTKGFPREYSTVCQRWCARALHPNWLPVPTNQHMGGICRLHNPKGMPDSEASADPH